MKCTVCIPVLNRYDKLSLLVESLQSNTIKPEIAIVNNGTQPITLKDVLVYTPGRNIGVAASWNWFIKNVPELRIISNDDIIFGETAIESFIENYDKSKIVFPSIAAINVFSCFMIPDNIVNRVGLFDEGISPNYGYFEDNDYAYRMKLLGIDVKRVISITAFHSPSSTIEMFSTQQKKEHDKKFKLAKVNYISKWGGLPGKETFITPYNRK